MFGNTVDGAIRGLLRAQAKLEAVAVEHSNNAERLNEKASTFIDKANTSMSEAERAQRVVKKLQEITEA